MRTLLVVLGILLSGCGKDPNPPVPPPGPNPGGVIQIAGKTSKMKITVKAGTKLTMDEVKRQFTLGAGMLDSF